MTKNYIFREFESGLSIEETAELCLKTARTVKEWDKGKTIPPECKRLMRMTKGRVLSSSEAWESLPIFRTSYWAACDCSASFNGNSIVRYWFKDRSKNINPIIEVR